jgi:hypothetical protein
MNINNIKAIKVISQIFPGPVHSLFAALGNLTRVGSGNSVYVTELLPKFSLGSICVGLSIVIMLLR